MSPLLPLSSVTALAAALAGLLAFSLDRQRPSSRLRIAGVASLLVLAAQTVPVAGAGEARLPLTVGAACLLLSVALRRGRKASLRGALLAASMASLLVFSLGLVRPPAAEMVAAAAWLALGLAALRLRGLPRVLLTVAALPAALGSAPGLWALSSEALPGLAVLGALGTILAVAAWPVSRSMALAGELAEREREAEGVALRREATCAFRRIVADCAGPEELLDRSLDVLAACSGAEVAGVLLCQGEKELEVAAHRNLPPAILEELRSHPLSVDEGLLAPVLKEGLLVDEDPFDNPRLSRNFPVMDGWRSLLMAPLVARGRVLGVVALAARVPEAFDEHVPGLLEEMGETLGLSLEESRSRQRLVRQRRLSQEILQRAGLIVVGLDPSLRVSVFNRAAEEATGYRAAEIVGESFPERLLPDRDREEGCRRHLDYFGGGSTPAEHAGPILTRDGRELKVRWRYALLPGDRHRPARLLAFGLELDEAGETPRSPLPPSPPRDRLAETSPSLQAGTGEGRLLVVDDEESVVEVLRECLGREGYRVDCARNGREALDRLRIAEYDGVISDLRMPSMSGPDLFGVLSRRWPELSRHVLLLTGDTNHPRSREFIERSGCALLEKPFEIEELIAAVRQVARPPSTRKIRAGAGS